MGGGLQDEPAAPLPRAKWRRRALIAVCVISVALMVAEVLLARGIAAGALTIWQLELLVLPWVAFVGSYLSIVSTSWFDTEGSSTLIRRALSLIVAAVVLGGVTLLYFVLVF